MSSCSSASAHSLPCGSQVAKEKVRGCPALSRLRSDGAGWGQGRGEVVVGEGEGGFWFGTGGVGGGSEGARVWTHSATSVTEEVWVVPPSEV